MRVLVTGGAGYIGSHTVRTLRRRGDDVVVLDTLDHGSAEAVGDATLIRGDVTDETAVNRLFSEQPFDAVIHLAALKSVDESLRRPEAYFRVNVTGSLTMLEAAAHAGVEHFVFSSTCAVYGPPAVLPVTEAMPTRPETPYGESKLAVERMLPWFEHAHGLRSVSLRYFNAAGAAEEGDLGEDWDQAVNLVPVVMKAVMGAGPPVRIFGTDYATVDGTAVRDYIHVLDLADAHIRAIDYLVGGGRSSVINLGTGQGASVREVIAATESVSGRRVPTLEAPRRPGDPEAIWADPSLAHQVLGWSARRDLDDIIGSAWRWHSSGS